MMPFELRGNALKPIKESHWKVLVTVWPWIIIMVQTTAWMTYDKLLCWRLMYYRRFEELCKSRNLVLYSCTQIPQILPLVPRNLRLYLHMPRDIPFQLWICSRLKDLMIVSTSIVSVSVCTHHIFVSLILCIWFVSSTVYMITKTLQPIFICRPSITGIFAHDIVFVRYTQVYLKLISDNVC